MWSLRGDLWSPGNGCSDAFGFRSGQHHHPSALWWKGVFPQGRGECPWSVLRLRMSLVLSLVHGAFPCTAFPGHNVYYT